MSPQLSSQHIKSICNKHLARHFCPTLILVTYVQEVEVSARQYSQATSHILAHLQYAIQFFSPLFIFVLFTGVFVFE